MEIIEYLMRPVKKLVKIEDPVPDEVLAVFIGELDAELLDLYSKSYCEEKNLIKLIDQFENLSDQNKKQRIGEKIARAKSHLTITQDFFNFKLNEKFCLWGMDENEKLYFAQGNKVYYHDKKHCGCLDCQIERIDDRIAQS